MVSIFVIFLQQFPIQFMMLIFILYICKLSYSQIARHMAWAKLIWTSKQDFDTYCTIAKSPLNGNASISFEVRGLILCKTFFCFHACRCKK